MRCSTLHAIRELQIKTAMTISTHLLEQSKFKVLTTVNTDKNVEQQKLLHHWWECKIVCSLWKIVHTPTIQSSNHTPWYLSKRAENLYLYKNLHTDSFSNFIHKCQNLNLEAKGWTRLSDFTFTFKLGSNQDALQQVDG